MSKRIWFFGDSFTAGYGATPGTEYYREFGPGKTFSTLLSEYFNRLEYNFGRPGCCNNVILSSIINQLINITSDDLVVISNTSPYRDLVPHNTEPRLTSQKLFTSRYNPESIGYSNPEIDKALSEYCLKVRLPYTEVWNHHYRSQFIDLIHFLENRGTQSIFWDYSVWSEDEEPGMKFENIFQATNGKVYDLHWSYKGHQDAYEWIKNGLEKQIKFLK